MTTTITGATGVNQITDDAVTHAKLPAGSVVQVVYSSNTTSYSNINPNTDSSGGTSGSGGKIFDVNFTPRFTDSFILVQTNPIYVYEDSNSGDHAWGTIYLDSVWKGKTNRGTHHTVARDSKNFGFIGFNNHLDSWAGTKAIKLYVGMNGAGTYVNASSNYNENGQNQLTILEISQ